MIDPVLAQFIIPPEVDEGTQAAIDATCEAFLRGGGHFTWKEWASLQVETRASLAAAGDRIAVDRLRRAFLGEPDLGASLQKAADSAVGVP